MTAILKYIQPKLYALSNGLFANWLPDTAIVVGDYGVLKNGGFERLGSLRDHGAQFDVHAEMIDGQGDPPGKNKNELEYKDKIDLAVNAIAEATVPAKQGVKVTLRIKGRGGFLYHLFDVRRIRPVNRLAFEDEVAKVLIGSSLILPEEGVLVTEVQHAAKATIIVSDHNDGKLELTTNFKPTGSAFLSGAKGSISVGASVGSLFSWIAKNDTVTLLRLVRPTLPPPGGPHQPAGGLQAALAWARNFFKAHHLSVSQLVIRPRLPSSDVVVVALGNDELRLSLPEVTLEDLLATIADQVEEETFEGPIDLEVPAQSFGKRFMTG